MSQYRPPRVKPLPWKIHRRRPQASSKPVRMTPLRDDRGHLIGYVDPAFGRLYGPNMQPSRPIVGLRRSRAHQARRDAADKLGIRANASVAQAEEEEFEAADAAAEELKGKA